MVRENKGRREGRLNNRTIIEEILKQRKKNEKITINENVEENRENKKLEKKEGTNNQPF
jgi:hypothetical protein